MNPQRLIAARKARGMTQKELGEALKDEDTQDSNVSKMKIYRYERGIIVPPYSVACELAKILDIPECYLYTEDDLLAEQILNFYKNKNIKESLLTLLTEKTSKVEQYEKVFNIIKDAISQLK
ncbi:helix-turn-helix domain-containing protein [Xenorhabdus stockiae]|uniref:helix-turn-helix domain-containing protein n=1 Tax=Xenorhabdus stockiae TaxID=351614 RepID=UPI0040639D81